jgi:hypothetical protein
MMIMRSWYTEGHAQFSIVVVFCVQIVLAVGVVAFKDGAQCVPEQSIVAC